MRLKRETQCAFCVSNANAKSQTRKSMKINVICTVCSVVRVSSSSEISSKIFQYHSIVDVLLLYFHGDVIAIHCVMSLSLYMVICYYYYTWWDVIMVYYYYSWWDVIMVYYYYSWRDVITIHGEMLLLFMARCYYYSWRDVITIHGEMLLWSIITIHGAMLLLSMARCYYYPCQELISLSMAICLYSYPWRDVIHGEIFCYQYSWQYVIITVHDEML